jgi:hypothetical protein
MYYIYDCNDQIVGNPKGYRTFRGANQQANGKRSKVYQVLWDRYHAKRKEKPHWLLISQIKGEQTHG